ncbi:hypothetical protein [Parasitella parasitica]|uniref:Uncharacterized protein n=1 Tax=Parasitella parasitica TaxID=35722 RepID=A0A0B7N4U3_9FUNG|nr:hypothetical protein [Parasitella parasitica]
MSITNINPLHDLKGHQASITAVEYSEKSFLGHHLLVSGSDDKTCRIWDLESKKVLKGIKNLADPVTSIKFAKKNQPYIYLSSGTKVLVYDLGNEGIIITDPIRTYDFSNDEINSIDVSDNNKFLATADDEGIVNIIDLGTHNIYKKTLVKHSNICMSVKFRAKQSWQLWSGGMDSKLYEWDFSRGIPTNIYDTNSKEPSSAQMFNPPFVYEIATSHTGEWIAAGLGDGTVRLLAPSSKKQKKQSREISLENGHNFMVNSVSFLTKEKPLLISGSANGRVTVWDHENDTHPIVSMFQLDAKLGKLNSLTAFERDGALCIAAAGTGALHIYQLD